MKGRLWHIILLLTAVLFVSTSCEPDVAYSRYKHIDAKGWNRGDTLRFETDTVRHDGTYGFCCCLRTQRDYPYQTVVVLVERDLFRNKTLMTHKRERVTCPIVTRHGKTLGDGVASRQHEATIMDLDMKAGDSVSVRIFHQMTKETLPGIIDVGLIMERK